MNTKLGKFVLFHQPKTGGSYFLACVPQNYVLGHYKNYNYCLNRNYNFENTKLVCIIRNPLDYYISSITFWCIDPIKKNSINKKNIEEFKKRAINDNEAHPRYWMSNGFTTLNLNKILNNLFDDDFINKHKDKLSKNHHTYDIYIFLIMSRLNIGFYTLSFLDQYSRKKISDIKSHNECREELLFIKNNFIVLNQSNLKNELIDLCKKYNVKMNKENLNKRVRKSSRKKISEYNFSKELINKIRQRDNLMFEIFPELKIN